MFEQNKKEQKMLEAIRIAKSIINGEINLIAGTRKLYPVLCKLELEGEIDKTSSYLGILAIDSDTDHLPIGNPRKHYAPYYLTQLDKEMDDYVRNCRSQAIEFCREIIKLLEEN